MKLLIAPMAILLTASTLKPASADVLYLSMSARNPKCLHVDRGSAYAPDFYERALKESTENIATGPDTVSIICFRDIETAHKWAHKWGGVDPLVPAPHDHKVDFYGQYSYSRPGCAFVYFYDPNDVTEEMPDARITDEWVTPTGNSPADGSWTERKAWVCFRGGEAALNAWAAAR